MKNQGDTAKNSPQPPKKRILPFALAGAAAIGGTAAYMGLKSSGGSDAPQAAPVAAPAKSDIDLDPLAPVVERAKLPASEASPSPVEMGVRFPMPIELFRQYGIGPQIETSAQGIPTLTVRFEDKDKETQNIIFKTEADTAGNPTRILHTCTLEPKDGNNPIVGTFNIIADKKAVMSDGRPLLDVIRPLLASWHIHTYAAARDQETADRIRNGAHLKPDEKKLLEDKVCSLATAHNDIQDRTNEDSSREHRLKTGYATLEQEKEKLHNEILVLKTKLRQYESIGNAPLSDQEKAASLQAVKDVIQANQKSINNIFKGETSILTDPALFELLDTKGVAHVVEALRKEMVTRAVIKRNNSLFRYTMRFAQQISDAGLPLMVEEYRASGRPEVADAVLREAVRRSQEHLNRLNFHAEQVKDSDKDACIAYFAKVKAAGNDATNAVIKERAAATDALTDNTEAALPFYEDSAQRSRAIAADAIAKAKSLINNTPGARNGVVTTEFGKTVEHTSFTFPAAGNEIKATIETFGRSATIDRTATTTPSSERNR